jgi:hypothetical protein
MANSTHIPGIKASHKVISFNCRAVHGDKAIDMALAEIKTRYKNVMGAESNHRANIHIMLTVDRTGENDEIDT